MQIRKYIPGLSSEYLVIFLAALVKFAIHLYTAPGYSFFIDEFYTAALSRHLAFGYVDLPPLVPVLMALSRALLGESLLAMHVFPALAGAFTLVFVCLITREFGGRTFAVALAALGFLGGTLWLGLNSIFAYDSFDQLVLAGFLFTLARFLKTGNRRLWIVLGLLAGLALNTKMTLLFMGPGFLAGLLISKYRRDLLTAVAVAGGGNLPAPDHTLSAVAGCQRLADARILDGLQHHARLPGFALAVFRQYSRLHEPLPPAVLDRRVVPRLSPHGRCPLRVLRGDVPGHAGAVVLAARHAAPAGGVVHAAPGGRGGLLRRAV